MLVSLLMELTWDTNTTSLMTDALNPNTINKLLGILETKFLLENLPKKFMTSKSTELKDTTAQEAQKNLDSSEKALTAMTPN